jgi:hypothetical protein
MSPGTIGTTGTTRQRRSGMRALVFPGRFVPRDANGGQRAATSSSSVPTSVKTERL